MQASGFHGGDAVAPLKGGGSRANFTPANGFHGGDAVAPLKVPMSSLCLRHTVGFHGGDAVAPLKERMRHGEGPAVAHVSTAATPWLH